VIKVKKTVKNAQGNHNRSDLGAGPVDLELLQAVGKNGRHLVSLLDASASKAFARRLMLLLNSRWSVSCLKDHGQAIRSIASVVSEKHPMFMVPSLTCELEERVRFEV